LIPGTVSQLLICVSTGFVRQFTNRRRAFPPAYNNCLFFKRYVPDRGRL